jgi:hypothetical protein
MFIITNLDHFTSHDEYLNMHFMSPSNMAISRQVLVVNDEAGADLSTAIAPDEEVYTK